MEYHHGPLVGSGTIYDNAGERIFFTKGAGPFVFSDKQEKYVDFILGVGPVIIGHGDPEFNSILADGIAQGLNLPSYSVSHFEYADALMDGSPGHHVVVVFTKTSSEAVVFALRLAAIETGKIGVIRCGYLGQADVAMGRSISWHEPLNSLLREEVKLTSGCRGLTKSEPVLDWTDLRISTLSEMLAEPKNCVGAIAIDAHQFVFMTPDAVEEIVALCKKYGVKLILDETKTSGRDNPRGYFDSYTRDLDYVIFGKAIGNGAPIAVLTGKAESRSLYRQGRIGGTHSKELFGAIAGNATLKIMRDRCGYTEIKSLTRRVVNAFNAAIACKNFNSQIEAKAFLSDTIFELCWKGDLLQSASGREHIKRALHGAGVLILEGHCSFICVQHNRLDFDQLSEQISVGLEFAAKRRF